MKEYINHSRPTNLIPAALFLMILVILPGCDRLGMGTSLNEPPAGMINLPQINAEFSKGEPIKFSAFCTDEEDGMLEGNSLIWTSDIDGELGRGNEFTRDDLSPGTHKITLVMRDSKGAKDMMSLKIRVYGTENSDDLVNSACIIPDEPISLSEFDLILRTSKNFDCKNLNKLNLSKRILTKTSFRGAYLSSVNLSRSDLT